MNRYIAIVLVLLVLCVPQFASAASVSFGAGLDADGGHAGGSGVDTGIGTPVTGKMHWSGTAVKFDNGWIIGAIAILEGKVTRSNDPALDGKSIRVICNSEVNSVSVTVLETGAVFSGIGNVTIK